MATIHSSAALTFILQTAAVQILSAATVVLGWQVLENLPALTLLACAAAYSTAYVLRMPPSWRTCNALLPLATVLSLAVDLPAWVFFATFMTMVAIYAPALWTRVPYYPTHRAAYALILAELPTDRPFVFLDIGCGFGDLLFFLQSRRPLGTFVGYEVGLLPWVWGSMRTKILRTSSVSIRFQDMWRGSLTEYDFVYTFLSPAAMERIWEKVATEMKEGSVFITNSFPVPASPHETLQIRDPRGSKLYIHRIKCGPSPQLSPSHRHNPPRPAA